MVTSRRSFLITGGSLILSAPAIVKASSLDAILRGYNMDPLVLAFKGTMGAGNEEYRESVFSPRIGAKSYADVAAYCAKRWESTPWRPENYVLKRRSELENGFWGTIVT